MSGETRIDLGARARYKPCARLGALRSAAASRAAGTIRRRAFIPSDPQVFPAMSLLSRYILSEVVQVFVVSLVALTMVFVFVGVGKEAYNNGFDVLAIMRLMPYLLPTALLFGVPAALLFAVTTAFGRMSAGGEIIALKALGISPGVVLMPIGVLAVLLSLVTFWLNDIAFSWGEIGTRRVVVDAFEEIAYSVLRKKHSFSSPQFSVTVQQVEGHRLIQPIFTFQEIADSRRR